MKTLILMRHAKSDWSGPDVQDHDRPLNARGEKAAARMAGYFMDNGLLPDMVFCSTAKRARQTLDALLEVTSGDLPVHYRRALYFTSPDVILDEIRDTPDSVTAPVNSLMLVGHNPDTQAVALHLAHDAHDPNVVAMARKFPTGAAAIFRFDVNHWQDIAWGSGSLLAFLRPKTLKVATDQ